MGLRILVCRVFFITTILGISPFALSGIKDMMILYISKSKSDRHRFTSASLYETRKLVNALPWAADRFITSLSDDIGNKGYVVPGFIY